MFSDWWKKVKKNFDKISEKMNHPFLHIVIVGLICIGGLITFNIASWEVKKASAPWIEKIRSSKIKDKESCRSLLVRLDATFSTNHKEKVQADAAKRKELLTAQCERLIEQQEYIQAQIILHSDLMQYLYTNMFAALITALIAGLLAMIVLVFVSKKGWQQVNSYLLVAFLSLSAVAGFYGAFPTMFEQETNAEANKELCIGYDNVIQEINDHFATIFDKDGKPSDINKFIHSISKRITELHSIPFGMNPEEAVSIAQKVRDILQQQGATSIEQVSKEGTTSAEQALKEGKNEK